MTAGSPCLSRPRSPAPDASNKKMSTRNTDIPARSAVFATTELLENVLQNLPSKAIAKSQMVSRKFRDVVEESPTLQVKLFNQPDPDTRQSQTPWAVRSLPVDIGPWGCIWSAPPDHGLQLVHVHEKPLMGIDTYYVCFREVELNWAIFDRMNWSSDTLRGRLRGLTIKGGEVLTFTPESTYSLRRLLHGETQSWERSYIADPPCTRALIVVIIKFGPRKSPEPVELYIDAWVEKREGVTLGDLLETVLSKKTSTDPFQHQPILTEGSKTDYVQKFDGCIRDLICSLETKHKAEAWISAEGSSVVLRRLIVPTDEDRKNVVEVGKRDSDRGTEEEAGWWQAQLQKALKYAS